MYLVVLLASDFYGTGGLPVYFSLLQESKTCKHPFTRSLKTGDLFTRVSLSFYMKNNMYNYSVGVKTLAKLGTFSTARLQSERPQEACRGAARACRCDFYPLRKHKGLKADSQQT